MKLPKAARSFNPVSFEFLAWVAVLSILIGAYRLNFLLFHTLLEILTIIVGGVVFVIAWHTRRYIDNGYLLFVGIASLFIAVIDLCHLLTYGGMNIIPGLGGNPPTQLWIGARYLQGLTILCAPLFLRRNVRPGAVFAAFTILTIALLLSVFVWPLFPTCFAEGGGLTPFKKISEYVISGFMAGGLFLLLLRRKALHAKVVRPLATSIALSILSELTFTLYVHFYDLVNFAGHMLKLVAFYFLYQAIIRTCLVRPFDLLFRSLKESERSLKEERDFASAVIQTAGGLVMVVDCAGRIVRFNRTCELVTGFRFEEVKGRLMIDLLSPEDALLFQEKMKECATVDSACCDFHLLTKSGERRLVLWSRTLLPPGGKGSPFAVLTGIDVSERRKAEERIEVLNTDLAARAAELEAANEELETFSHSVSHDLRRPLTNINGYSQVILQLFPDINADCRQYVRNIYDETLKMNSLIDTLLEFSHIARNEPRKQSVDLSKMARITGEELRHSSPDRKVSLEVEEGIMALADPDLIRIVIENILSNAWKYTAQRETAIVRVRQVATSNKSVVVIEDNGAGFDMDKAERLFLPFQRLHSGYEGHGIGLATVQRIIHRHGGRVWAEGEPGQGARFFFTLPQ